MASTRQEPIEDRRRKGWSSERRTTTKTRRYAGLAGQQVQAWIGRSFHYSTDCSSMYFPASTCRRLVHLESTVHPTLKCPHLIESLASLIDDHQRTSCNSGHDCTTTEIRAGVMKGRPLHWQRPIYKLFRHAQVPSLLLDADPCPHGPQAGINAECRALWMPQPDNLSKLQVQAHATQPDHPSSHLLINATTRRQRAERPP